MLNPPNLPFLKSIGWQINNINQLTEKEMLQLYQRNWHHKSTFRNFSKEEKDFVHYLAQKYKSWILSDLEMFNLSHHNTILNILNNFNSEVLKNAAAHFAGGTLLALEYDEYRLSKDIDFLFPYATENYRYLRNLVYDAGIEILFQNTRDIQLGESTINQYGIRFPVTVNETTIKVEIVANGAFTLDPPVYPKWANIPCLSISDRFTSKLMANADRWNDSSTQSRDLIDLAMLRVNNQISLGAIAKAEQTYEVRKPLLKAINNFLEKEEHRSKCFQQLNVPEEKKATIMNGIDLLIVDFQ
ncbi:nucleotidyl transferase AbiEii/AbiGii toxin family protein [Calothrix anomala FACHB-343]|uniref:Nucleotidyl transferase AbiEii/AbiGii toxin family protein n=3 Tax=Calotrichaceae TaxID=2661849 RepID=A0ABR8A5G4_9CYAN|nr:nucleotidyl transferase AbiEii/AbiGii toxin family protein [Calothrix parietina FACHB-288]MBD2223706.1 nucleotidyl transferase AbiEii/AbiGii toxin family protein [Calothrix anomala FACHB-343]